MGERVHVFNEQNYFYCQQFVAFFCHYFKIPRFSTSSTKENSNAFGGKFVVLQISKELLICLLQKKHVENKEIEALKHTTTILSQKQ